MRTKTLVVVAALAAVVVVGLAGCERKPKAIDLRNGWAIVDRGAQYAPQKFDDQTLKAKLQDEKVRPLIISELERQLQAFAKAGVAVDMDSMSPASQALRIARLSPVAAAELVEKGLIYRLR